MKGKIIVTSAYPEFTILVKEAAVENDIEVIVVEKVLEDALYEVQKLLDQFNVDVIVSRGGTAELLKDKIAVPVISAAPSEFDILQTLARVTKTSCQIGYFGYPGITDRGFIEQMESILGIQLKYYPFLNTKELAIQVENAHRDGCEVVVGGGYTGARIAKAYGMEGLIIYSSRRTVASALKQAKDIWQLREQERDESERQRKNALAKGFVAHYSFADLIGTALTDTIKKARRFSKADATVLIWGESGTGKELFAQSIHASSTRSQGPFVAVNCAALPENLLESELFGYEEGAFTGAKRGGKIGLFELANGGTIFLDEVSKMPLNVQSRLLRVLQAKEVRRVGGERQIEVNVRVITATNENLQLAVEKGNFRDDLYYRLNVLNLQVPPLRERKEDIPLLVEKTVAHLAKKLGYKPYLNQTFMQALQRYPWPGNVRELENLLERYAVLVGTEKLDYAELIGSFPELLQETDSVNTSAVSRADSEAYAHSFKTEQDLAAPLVINPGTLEEMEIQCMAELLKRCKGNRTQLAEMLGISRTTLWKRLQPAIVDLPH